MTKNPTVGNLNVVSPHPSRGPNQLGSLCLTGAPKPHSTPFVFPPSSILCFPVEIFINILLLAQCDINGRYLNVAVGGDTCIPTLILVSQVCKLWRDVAFATPLLWARLSVTINDHSLGAKPIAVLDAFLQRSKECLLHLDVDIDVGPGVPLGPLLELLRRHAGRWEDVRLTLSHHHMIRLLAAPLPLPNLVRFYLRTPYGSESDDSNTPPCITFDAPRLLSVAFDMENIPTASQFRLPWGQLTACQGISGSVPELLLVLRKLSSARGLEQCSLVYADESVMLGMHLAQAPVASPTHTRLDRVCLPSLKKLNIRVDAEDATTVHLLRSICCPKLQTLTIESLDASPDPELGAFLERTDSITHLTLGDVRGVESIVAHALRVLPRLAQVTICGACSLDAIKHVLQCKAGGHGKELRTLMLQDDNYPVFYGALYHLRSDGSWRFTYIPEFRISVLSFI
ncbi:hypothetical protein HGRIS_010918 [Hohenbuehelia grisea]|uniref:F-box domain-containing protein n=1 Tax=Hohenbuehelia grisea TaxID=104357 RepID=A0ABR3IY83_9AGAR